MTSNPRPTNGSDYHTPREFPLVVPKQKSDWSHLGNLKYILYGHFDEKIDCVVLKLTVNVIFFSSKTKTDEILIFNFF